MSPLLRRRRGLGDTHCTVTPNGARVCYDDVQQQILATKADALASAPGNIRSNLTNHTPADSHPFVVTSQPFANYPAPGAAAAAILTYQVPPGQVAVIKQLAIVAIGGGFVDGSGNVIWRCWVNGQPVDGLQDIEAHMGNFDAPQCVQLVLQENDIFLITVEVPAAQPPMPDGATTGARIIGWNYPLVKAQNL